MARKFSETQINLSEDIATLAIWIKEDVLSITGPKYLERLKILNFILEELTKKTLWRLEDTSLSWLSEGPPHIRQFESLDNYLNGHKQKWVESNSKLPKRRKLTADERNNMYEKLKHKIADTFTPDVQAGLILPMFYKDTIVHHY